MKRWPPKIYGFVALALVLAWCGRDGARASSVAVQTKPGGPVNSIQFNNPLGIFAGNLDLLWNEATQLLSVGDTTNAALPADFMVDLQGELLTWETYSGGNPSLFTIEHCGTTTVPAACMSGAQVGDLELQFDLNNGGPIVQGTAFGVSPFLETAGTLSTSIVRTDVYSVNGAAGHPIFSMRAKGDQSVMQFNVPAGVTLGQGGIVFASLPAAPTNGDSVYCSDCTVTSGIDDTCANGGSGAFAKRINGAWKCDQ